MNTKKLEILLVDDDDVFLMMYRRLLKKAGVDMAWVKNYTDGFEVLEYLKANYNTQTAYLIFLDINMPKMGGWGLIDAVRGFVSKENFFVLIVTSSADISDMEQAKRENLVLKYIYRPLTLEQIEDIICQEPIKSLLT
jgi:CheY-like chemotaxis protein